MKTHLNATALSLLALGALTSSLFACGDETAQSNDPATGEQAEAITARGIAVTGCGANGVFNVVNTDNLASNIDFIAIDQSDFANLTSQLSSFNAQNQQQLVSNSADTLDSSLQTAINELTNETTAHQASVNRLKEHQASAANTSIIETASHSDSSLVTTDTSSVVESSRSGSADSRALQTAASFDMNLANARAFNNTEYNNSTSNFAAGGGGVALPIAFGVAQTAPFFSSAAFAQNSASASNSNVNSAKNVNSAFNLVASNSNNKYADYTRQAQSQHTSAATANEWSRTLQSSTADEQARDLYSEAATEASQAASQRSANSSKVQAERASHVAFENLASLAAKNFQLNVNMQAADNQSHTLRVFTGKDSQITAMRNFAISFPSCVGIDP